LKKKIKKRAIYPGSFDPVTNGHMSLIERACSIFDELIVAVAGNTGKNPFFDHEERIQMMIKSLARRPGVDKIKVIGFDCLLADLAVEMNAVAIIRGLRAVSDFEYEFQMALMNRKIARQVETVFLMPALSWVYLSSTIVKDVARHGGDVKGLVPLPVKKAFDKRYGRNRKK